jgi:hypothetical protein
MRKILCIIITILLTLSCTVFAETNGKANIDKELESLILSVKAKIEIPEKLSEFRYNLEVGKGEAQKLYSLTWDSKKGENGSIMVRVQEDGNIVSYQDFGYITGRDKVPQISYNEGLYKAREFLRKVLPNSYESLKEDIYVKPNGSNKYTYGFQEYVNGVKVLNSKFVVVIDNQKGSVIEFSGNPSFKGNYSALEGIISQEEAANEYLNKIDFEYMYEIFQQGFMPTYLVDNRKLIDAVTGDTITRYEDKKNNIKYNPFRIDSVYIDKTLPTEKYSEEVKVPGKEAILTKEAAVERLKECFPIIEDADIVGTTINKNSKGYTKNAWSIECTKDDKTINANVDSITGEILNYECKNKTQGQENRVSIKDAREKVAEFIKKALPQSCDKIEYYDKTSSKDDDETNYAKFTYVRMENGIPVSNHKVYIKYDLMTDEISEYHISWENISFKNVDGAKSKEEIIKQNKLQLFYVNKDKDNRILAYGYQGDRICFNPITGNRMNLVGGDIKEDKPLNYSDINNHWVKDIVTKLYDAGISFDGTELKPDESITQVDFLRLLLNYEEASSYTDEKVYETAKSSKIIINAEINKNSKVTKEDAVKFIISRTKYKNCAKLDKIYVYPFSDEDKLSKELKGDVALAYAFGIIDDKKGSEFNPKKEITRAEALKLIYNKLKADI